MIPKLKAYAEFAAHANTFLNAMHGLAQSRFITALDSKSAELKGQLLDDYKAKLSPGASFDRKKVLLKECLQGAGLARHSKVQGLLDKLKECIQVSKDFVENFKFGVALNGAQTAAAEAQMYLAYTALVGVTAILEYQFEKKKVDRKEVVRQAKAVKEDLRALKIWTKMKHGPEAIPDDLREELEKSLNRKEE